MKHHSTLHCLQTTKRKCNSAERLNVSASSNDEVIVLLTKQIKILESILKATGHDIVLNDGVLVGRLAPAIDRELGTIKIKKNRGNI